MSRIAFAVPGDLTTLTGGYIYDRRLIEELRALGWTVDHIALPAGFPNPTPQQMSEALQLLKNVPPDCPVIIDGLAFGALDPEGVKTLTAPIIALVHHPLAKENGQDAKRQDLLFHTERQNLERVAHVIVPSPHTAEILMSDYDVNTDRITIAKPGIDQPTARPHPTAPPLILSVGIQLPRKGHDVLLKALSEIVDLDWQAVIVGTPLDPDYANMLQSLCTELGLDERVKLAGQLEQGALETLYAQASLFALATRYEGYGIVFDEALVHGLPIVACDTGAVRDTVPHGAGTLVPPDHPAAFATALRDLLSDPAARLACATASARAGEDRPGWDQTARIVSDALTDIFEKANQT